jgi:hypothetical protein
MSSNSLVNSLKALDVVLIHEQNTKEANIVYRCLDTPV